MYDLSKYIFEIFSTKISYPYKRNFTILLFFLRTGAQPFEGKFLHLISFSK
jgi:hypothetical protein